MVKPNKTFIAYVFMYINDATKYPNADTDEFACYLFGQDIEQIKHLFTAAVQQTGIRAEDLTIMPLLISNDADQSAVESHLKVAAFEEKAIFTPADMNPNLSISKQIMDEFLTQLYKTEDTQGFQTDKLNEIFPKQKIAV